MYKCNYCGKSIQKSATVEPPLFIRYSFGYHSDRDMSNLNACLCGKCTEDLTQHLIAKCVINPIYESVVV